MNYYYIRAFTLRRPVGRVLMIVTVLFVVALICFLLATANYPVGINVGWLGAAFITLALLIPGIHA